MWINYRLRWGVSDGTPAWLYVATAAPFVSAQVVMMTHAKIEKRAVVPFLQRLVASAVRGERLDIMQIRLEVRNCPPRAEIFFFLSRDVNRPKTSLLQEE